MIRSRKSKLGSAISVGMAWKPLFSLILLSALVIHEEWLLSPSCQTLKPFAEEDEKEELKVMMVANLLLSGSESRFLSRVFRDHHTSRFFANSFKKLEPDMLVVLGDVSARGSELTKSKWYAVVRQLHGVLGPFLGVPLHVVLGDRDVGRCGELGAKSVDWIAGRFPGLDATGCGAFEIGNVSFVSLNPVALLCGNNDLRFGVEKVIEGESAEVRIADGDGEGAGWRGNAAPPGSGPVILVHFPLHRGVDENSDDRGFDGDDGPYRSMQNLPANATQYIFQALKPRIIFTGHSGEFSVYTHVDGTYEVAVPSTTWDAKDDPAFIVAIFRRNVRSPSITYCTLARESRVVTAYISLLVLLALIVVLTKIHRWLISRR